MSNVIYGATLSPPATADVIDFSITPIAPFYISEVTIFLEPSYPLPHAYGKIKTGSAATPSHLSISVEPTIFNQITDCLGSSPINLNIQYTGTTVNNVFAESARALFARLEQKIDYLTKNLLDKDAEGPAYSAEFSEQSEKKVANR